MRVAEMIESKRDGGALRREDIDAFVSDYLRGDIPDYQAAALLMAVCVRGLSKPETLDLTQALRKSGTVLDLSDLPGPRADKNSTGGVGDKTSLIAAPLAAACGVFVPMIAGRGLAHAGGTLDRLESIPGLRVQLPPEELRAVLRDVGVAITGATLEVAPADHKLHALRDVAGAAEYPALIAASIMSRKTAEGLDGLVLDVKTGEGSFTPSLDDARALAQNMIEIGTAIGIPVSALVTDMSQPLGRTIGNALEVEEAIETLKGRGPKDLESLSLELAAWMVSISGGTETVEQARPKVRAALTSGAGLRKFQQMIERQGGDPRVITDRALLPRARETLVLKAPHDGRVAQIGCRAVGRGAMRLGAGRSTLESRVDPAVGVVLHKKIGELVVVNEPLLTIHYNDPSKLDHALPLLEAAIRLAPEAPPMTRLIRDVLHA